MIARAYKAYDRHSLNKWRKKRKLGASPAADECEIGFTVPGVAIGFIRRCEGSLGIFEGLISNPHASSLVRNAAMEAIYAQVLRHPDFDRIIGFSLDEGAMGRAQHSGFSLLPHRLLSWSKPK